MIKLVLPDHPDKHRVKPLDIPDTIEASPSDCYFETVITHNGEKPGKEANCWDIDVYVHLGPFQVRVPALSRANVNTRDMLYEMHQADNGETDGWVRQLIGHIDAEALWERSRDERT